MPERPALRTEVLAGVTTFVTMAYIVFVQPAVLGAAGMDPGAVFMATCLASAIATALMGWWANYPIAVAPAMGHNFFFAYTVVLAGGTPWQVALGAVAIAGVLFILTAGVGLRARVLSRLLPSVGPLALSVLAGVICIGAGPARFGFISELLSPPGRHRHPPGIAAVSYTHLTLPTSDLV